MATRVPALIQLSDPRVAAQLVVENDSKKSMCRIYYTGDQRDGEAALQGGGRGIRGSVGHLCGERRDVREGRSAP